MSGIHVIGGGTIPVEQHSNKKMIFDYGGEWGDRITKMEWPKKNNENLASIVGWKNPKPQIGDKLRVPMQSGKILVCKFVFIEYCGNPADMFFADIEPIKYEEKP